VWQPYHFRVLTVMKSGTLQLLEPSGPVQVCTEIALLLHSCFLSWHLSTGTSFSPKHKILQSQLSYSYHANNTSRISSFSLIQPFLRPARWFEIFFFSYLLSIYVFSLDLDIKFYTHKNFTQFLKIIAFKNLPEENDVKTKHMMTLILHHRFWHRRDKSKIKKNNT
jgi:hypothetical protein